MITFYPNKCYDVCSMSGFSNENNYFSPCSRIINEWDLRLAMLSPFYPYPVDFLSQGKIACWTQLSLRLVTRRFLFTIKCTVRHLVIMIRKSVGIVDNCWFSNQRSRWDSKWHPIPRQQWTMVSQPNMLHVLTFHFNVRQSASFSVEYQSGMKASVTKEVTQ